MPFLLCENYKRKEISNSWQGVLIQKKGTETHDLMLSLLPQKEEEKKTLGGITDELWAQLILTAWLILIMCSLFFLQLSFSLAHVVWLIMPGRGGKTNTQNFVSLLRNRLYTATLKSLSMLSWTVTGIHSLFKQ